MNQFSSANSRPPVIRLLEVPADKNVLREDLEDLLWIRDPEVAYRLANIIEDRGEKLLVGFRDDNGFYEKRTVFKKDTYPSCLSYYCEDLCNLSELNDATVLNSVRSRYEAQLIHTYSGLFCLVVNPWRNLPLYTHEIIKAFADTLDTTANLPPHVYAIAQSAYDGIFGGINQSILITGESGAGKTENTKKIIEYIGRAVDMRCYSPNRNRIDEKLTAAGVVIESFANASTIHNSNSSRVGKFIKMDFNENMLMLGAQIQCYLLEKSRVVKQNEGDRNFHVFYQLLSNGFDQSVRHALGLEPKANVYRFLNQGGKITDADINDEKDAIRTIECLKLLNFDGEEIKQIYEIVASCILLGEIKFTERAGFDITYVNGHKEVEAACRVLGLKANDLIDVLTQPSMKVVDSLIKKSQNLRKTLSSLAALCKCIYERLFKWILKRCNEALDNSFSNENSISKSYIGVLDMAGFEIMKKNSFEQFCINYTNEKLQQFFNDFMFIREQKEYLSEGIKWKRLDYGTDMQNTIELIEKPLGLLSLLQEECLVPKGSDKSLLEKLINNHSSSSVFSRSRQSARNTTISHFTVVHYAGQVEYNIDGWVEKNKDAVERSSLQLLSSSSKLIVRSLFPVVEEEMTRSRRQSMCSNTVSYVYKEQLLSLLETLNSTRAQFVRCISPNHTRTPGYIDMYHVLNQLKCNGVLEGVRICRQGYPNRLPFYQFVQRYRLLEKNNEYTLDRDGALNLCSALGLGKELVQVGKTKVYCKIGVISELENQRRSRLGALICGLQANIRWHNMQIDYKKRLEQREALVLIQNNVRHYAKTCTWKWFRLMHLVMPLIPMQQNKKRVEELEKENANLLQELEHLQDLYMDIQQKLHDSEIKIHLLKAENVAKETEKRELKLEMERHEELMEIMERRFDEQHAKVMKIHKCMRENEKKVENLEREKEDLDSQVIKWKEKYEKNCERETILESKIENYELLVDEYRSKFESIEECREKETQEIKSLKQEISALNDKGTRDANSIIEFQRLICHLNEKCSEFENKLSTEKRSRRKIESEKEKLESELNNIKDNAQKNAINTENLKLMCREKDTQIKKLREQLADNLEKTEININEMKKIHKNSKEELQNRIDELRKNCQKLEAENRKQKAKIDSMDRESSVESDYVSGRQSRLGSRQLSLNSILSYSSSRSRRGTEADKYSSGIRSSSVLTSSYHSEPHCLSRCTSQTNLANERKITQLERQLMSSNTDVQMLKREIEVYKSTLCQSERERDSLNQKIRNLINSTDNTERELDEEKRKVLELEMRLKKAKNDFDALREKHERSIQDSQSELIAERKKLLQRIDSLVEENEMKRKNCLSDRTITELQHQLANANNELDRAISQIAHLESISKSQEIYGETWENQYRLAASELESLRDENAMLKMKIRRQFREIELLKQQSEVEADVAFLEAKMGLVETKSNVCATTVD